MSTFTEYEIKLASKPLQKATFVFLLLFFACLTVIDIPMSDLSFPARITQVASILAQVFIIAAFVIDTK
jgi:hypothetical protein